LIQLENVPDAAPERTASVLGAIAADPSHLIALENFSLLLTAVISSRVRSCTPHIAVAVVPAGGGC
jgi:hypothetical protein